MAMITKNTLLLKLDNMRKHYEAVVRKSGDFIILELLEEITHLAKDLPEDLDDDDDA